LHIETAVQGSADAKHAFAKPQGWFESASSVNAHFRPMIAPLMFSFAVKRLVDSANAAAGKSRQFFERLDWTVIEKGDKYEPRRIGFHISTDFATFLSNWHTIGTQRHKRWQPLSPAARPMPYVQTTQRYDPGGFRTHDLRIKSPLLYQLSYRIDKIQTSHCQTT
jgi:hypothetical protein